MPKILIVKLSAIGDVIHCLPVAAALKDAIPGAQVSWLVEQTSAELLMNNKVVDEVIVFQAKSWTKRLTNPAELPKVFREAGAFFRQLRQKQFDVALEMQGLLKSGVLALASGAPLRMGFNGTREFAEQFLTHRVAAGDYFGHDVPVVELNLKIAQALLKHLGLDGTTKPKFVLPEPDPQAWARISAHFKDQGLDLEIPNIPNIPDIPYILNANMSNGNATAISSLPPNVLSTPGMMQPSVERQRFCVLIPGTTWITKIWPADYWVELGKRLQASYGYKLLIIGARSEVDLNKKLTAQLNNERPGSAIDLTNKTTLSELSALYRVCHLVVGGDTGPLHLAAAVGKPYVLGIYGSTPCRRNGPYGPQCQSVSLRLDCQPCYSKNCRLGTVECLTKLSVETVMDAIAQLIVTTPPQTTLAV